MDTNRHETDGLGTAMGCISIMLEPELAQGRGRGNRRVFDHEALGGARPRVEHGSSGAHHIARVMCDERQAPGHGGGRDECIQTRQWAGFGLDFPKLDRNRVVDRENSIKESIGNQVKHRLQSLTFSTLGQVRNALAEFPPQLSRSNKGLANQRIPSTQAALGLGEASPTLKS